MAKGVYIEMAHHPQAILDTMNQTQKDAHNAKQQWNLGCGFTIALIGVGALALLLRLILSFGLFLSILAFVLWGMAVIAGVALLISKPRFSQEQFEAVRQMLHTLRDDTGRKGWVAGWLDMTGPMQQTKQVRTARSGGGKQKVYYRDPWFQVKIKLVDGNLLRLSLMDKIKTKAGSVVNHRTQFTAKLVVNPDLYRVGAPPSTENSLAVVNANGSGVLSLRAEVDPRHPPVEQMLKSLKALYNHLEPIGQNPGYGS
jgi:hypothetical protein